MQKRDYFVIAGFIIFIAGFSFLYMNKSPEVVREIDTRVETIVVLKENGLYPDLPNHEQGTVVVRFKATPDDVRVGGLMPSKILLFRSKRVDGLAIYFSPENKKISGGMPTIESSEIDLLDGMEHDIAYSFKKGEQQILFFDKQVVGQSTYIPHYRNQITGFAIGTEDGEFRDVAGFQVYDYAMDEQSINRIG